MTKYFVKVPFEDLLEAINEAPPHQITIIASHNGSTLRSGDTVDTVTRGGRKVTKFNRVTIEAPDGRSTFWGLKDAAIAVKYFINTTR